MRCRSIMLPNHTSQLIVQFSLHHHCDFQKFWASLCGCTSFNEERLNHTYSNACLDCHLLNNHLCYSVYVFITPVNRVVSVYSTICPECWFICPQTLLYKSKNSLMNNYNLLQNSICNQVINNHSMQKVRVARLDSQNVSYFMTFPVFLKLLILLEL